LPKETRDPIRSEIVYGGDPIHDSEIVRDKIEAIFVGRSMSGEVDYYGIFRTNLVYSPERRRRTRRQSQALTLCKSPERCEYVGFAGFSISQGIISVLAYNLRLSCCFLISRPNSWASATAYRRS
jgi:hypothetical protein